MSRKFELNNLVQLPALDALGAQALGSAVVAAAAEKTLPGPVAEAVAEVKMAVDVLEAAAVQRLSKPDPVARAADAKVDAAWCALSGLLGALSRMPDHAHATLAATLRDQVFPDGLRFTRLPFRLEWAESANHLLRIDERGLAPQIAELGGATALAQVREAHARYGEVLSITVPSADAGINLREAWLGVHTALRFYVVRVIASVHPRDPMSAEVARDLRAPIENWQGTPRTTTTAPAPEGVGAGAGASPSAP